MKIPLLALGAVTAFGLFGQTTAARAQYYSRDREVIVERDRGDYRGDYRGEHRDYRGDRDWRRHSRPRTVYLIEGNRPVRREVFIDERGRYFRVIDGRPIIIRERVFDEYPSRYYYRDGRPRAGITLRFN